MHRPQTISTAGAVAKFPDVARLFPFFGTVYDAALLPTRKLIVTAIVLFLGCLLLQDELHGWVYTRVTEVSCFSQVHHHSHLLAPKHSSTFACFEGGWEPQRNGSVRIHQRIGLDGIPYRTDFGAQWSCAGLRGRYARICYELFSNSPPSYDLWEDVIGSGKRHEQFLDWMDAILDDPSTILVKHPTYWTRWYNVLGFENDLERFDELGKSRKYNIASDRGNWEDSPPWCVDDFHSFVHRSLKEGVSEDTIARSFLAQQPSTRLTDCFESHTLLTPYAMIALRGAAVLCRVFFVISVLLLVPGGLHYSWNVLRGWRRNYLSQARGVSMFRKVMDMLDSGACEDDEFSDRPHGACKTDWRPILGACGFKHARSIRLMVSIVRAKIGPQKHTRANELVVQRELLAAMKEHGMRPTHINQVLPYARRLFFVPTFDDLAALSMDAIFELQDRESKLPRDDE